MHADKRTWLQNTLLKRNFLHNHSKWDYTDIKLVSHSVCKKTG